MIEIYFLIALSLSVAYLGWLDWWQTRENARERPGTLGCFVAVGYFAIKAVLLGFGAA